MVRPPLEAVAVVKEMWTWAKYGSLASLPLVQGVWNYYFQSGQNNLVDISGREWGTFPKGLKL